MSPIAAFITGVILLTNAQRHTPLIENIENKALDTRAQMRAEWLCNYPFEHGNWTIWFAGFKYHYEGENLARDYKTPNDVVSAWIHSPEHLANIVNKHYRQIGVGRAVCDGFDITVQEFGCL